MRGSGGDAGDEEQLSIQMKFSLLTCFSTAGWPGPYSLGIPEIEDGLLNPGIIMVYSYNEIVYSYSK